MVNKNVRKSEGRIFRPNQPRLVHAAGTHAHRRGARGLYMRSPTDDAEKMYNHDMHQPVSVGVVGLHVYSRSGAG
jgi:hypothetical protein